jgi:predicted nucleic acid-binding protein
LTLLLDASVWIAALDSDDRFHDPARVLARSSEGGVAALDLTLYEVANVATRRWDDPESARDLCQLVVAACDLLIRVDERLLEEAIDVAAREQLTVYDAAYVAAAAHYGRVLVSADMADLVSRGLAQPPDYFK